MRVRYLLLTMLIFFSAFFNNLTCLAEKTKTKLAEEIENLIYQTDPNLNIGVKIKNLTTGEITYQKNSARYFIPASSLKFITITALLRYFGPNYEFNSTLLKKNQHYYLDIHSPNFTYHDLEQLLVKLGKDTKNAINGNIYLVNSTFSVPAMMREKLVSDTIYCNGGLITKVNLNKNCVKLKVSPTKIGRIISAKTPPNFPYQIINKAVTVNKNTLDRIDVQINQGKYIINGDLSTARNSAEIGAVTEDNFSNIIRYIYFFLNKHQIKLNGKVTTNPHPKEGKIVTQITHYYKDLASIAMQKSDNFITDYLLAEYANKQQFLQWRQAIFSLKNLIYQQVGVNLKKSKIYDGSGLARRNLISVDQMSDYLTAIYQSKEIKEIKALMAHPGDNSTLRNRFKNIKDIHLKTGTMRHVSSLIGYFKDKQGQEYNFVIMANNFYAYNQPYRKLEEKIIRLFTD